MNDAPTTRGRHALRWVLGVGLVFVVVVGMALQVARERADEQWRRVGAHWEETWSPFDLSPSWPYFRTGEGWTNYDPSASVSFSFRLTLDPRSVAFEMSSDREKFTDVGERHGNMFRSTRRVWWSGAGINLELRQLQSLFGSRIEGSASGSESALAEAVVILAAVDVELVVEQ